MHPADQTDLFFKLGDQTAREMKATSAELRQDLQRILNALPAVGFEQDSQCPDHDQPASGGDGAAAEFIDQKEIGAEVNRQLDGFPVPLLGRRGRSGPVRPCAESETTVMAGGPESNDWIG